jgi:hypothetical protein
MDFVLVCFKRVRPITFQILGMNLTKSKKETLNTKTIAHHHHIIDSLIGALCLRILSMQKFTILQ